MKPDGVCVQTAKIKIGERVVVEKQGIKTNEVDEWVKYNKLTRSYEVA